MVTTSERVWVFAVAPCVVALIVTGKVPSGVVDVVETVKVTIKGLVFVGDIGPDG